ncbi:MAM and LDL-receptor class A domain-containing protein 1-like [Diadema antillarum]|uniref:MAM and LDL-receptor class A domain-containing protein 1-like n=1 Tax=Diadema antillarum TaxID=105358 RepID=UPI003A86B55F
MGAKAVITFLALCGYLTIYTTVPAFGDISCDFEIDICNFTDDSTDDFDWTRKSGSSSTGDTGPDVDHTHGTSLGYYVYAEASSPQTQGSVARLISPSEDATQSKCVEFFYFMFGDHMGSLRVYVRDSDSTTLGDPVWEFHGESGRQWYKGRASIQQQAGSVEMIFEAEIGSGERSDIAIDDIAYSDGLCASDFVNCTFESGWCGFEQDDTDDFDFIRQAGSTLSYDTGPTVDHTLGTDDGFYVYIEGTVQDAAEVARLISPLFQGVQENDAESFCVVFYYHMYGDDIGELNVYLRNVTSPDLGRPIWSLAGTRGDVWRGAEAVINTPHDFNIVFEAIRGPSYESDIALDDIVITNYACPGYHVIKNESSVTCDFEEYELCYYTQDQTDDFDWEWRNRATPDSYSGPDADHTRGDELGFYMLVDSSSWSVATDKARLISPSFAAKKTPESCVEFWYHMYGTDVNRLNVYVKKDDQSDPGTLSFMMTGDQGNFWHRASFQVSVASDGDYRLVIEGMPGSEDRDDIAVDDITLHQDQACPAFTTLAPEVPTMPPATDDISCDFEEGFCGYTQDFSSDMADWNRYRGNQASWWSTTGPKVDHTYGTSTAYFVTFNHAQMTGISDGDNAILVSPLIAANPSSRCLTFYAYLDGYNVDYLNVYVREWGSTRSIDPQYATYGDQGKEWIEHNVDIPSSSVDFQVESEILFEAIAGGYYSAQISMDDISLNNGHCATATEEPMPWAADCSFETGDSICGYTNDAGNSMDWILHSGSTNSENTGPTNDHTHGSTEGHYVYLEASQPARPNEYGILRSPTINSGGLDFCFRFYYHAYGVDIGVLSVDIESTDGNSFSGQIFSLVGNQGNNWIPVNVNVAASQTGLLDFQILFEGKKTKAGSYGDIAIDDIKFIRQPCDGYPAESQCSFEQGPESCGFTNPQNGGGAWQWYDDLAVESPPLPKAATSSFMYADAGTVGRGNSAILYSQLHSLSGLDHCVITDFVLYGDTAQKITVEIIEQSTSKRFALGSFSGDHGQTWFRGNWSLPENELVDSFQIVYTATFGTSIGGVIALDNVAISTQLELCTQYVHPPTRTPTRRPTTTKPQSNPTTLNTMSTAASSDTITTVNGHPTNSPMTGGRDNTLLIVGIILIVLAIVVVAVITSVWFAARPSRTGKLPFGISYNKEKNLDGIPFSERGEGHGNFSTDNPYTVTNNSSGVSTTA